MKKLLIRAIGKLSEPWQRDACELYKTRLSKLGGVDISELPEGHGGSAKPDEARTRAVESEALLSGIPDRSWVVALDETGKSMTSLQFASALTGWNADGRLVVFLIGGSWGLDDVARKRANVTLSLGPMTLPHGLARVVLLEQLYRAKMIQTGRAYHK